MILHIKIYYFVVVVLVMLSNICYSQENVDSLLTESEKLKFELDKYISAEKFSIEIDKAFLGEDYSLVKQKCKLLFAKFPKYARNYEYKAMLKTIGQIELDEIEREEAEKQEKYRLANINNLGMWSIEHFHNRFEESNKNRFISNTSFIQGTFSNSEVQNAKLNAKFIINDSSKISIQLFEKAGNIPLKAWSDHLYIVIVQDREGNQFKINAINKSDRLEFDKNTSIQLHNTLLKGGNIKIKIHEYYNSGNTYNFSIRNAEFYKNAFRELTTN